VPVGPYLSAGVGGLAEHVLLPALYVVRNPGHMSLEQAAGLAVSGCAASVLVERARLKEGDRELINGASERVGTIVVQLVRQAVGLMGRLWRFAVRMKQTTWLREKLSASGERIICVLSVASSVFPRM
jgi:D-arabinose 1-dehydrogenase-like Zn-dependent alcohol dehydrogenase